MPIIRSPRPERDFSIVRNSIINDDRLSLEARFILLYLLSKPDTWNVNVPDLVNLSKSAPRKAGKAVVYAVLKELANTGFLTSKRLSTGGVQYTVYDVPQSPETITSHALSETEEVASKPLSENQKVQAGNALSEKPLVEKPLVENRDVLVKTDKAVKTEKAVKTKSLVSTDDRFRIFYDAYPRKRKPADARKAFKSLNPDDALLQTILAAIEVAKGSHEWRKDGGQFIPYPASWLRAEQWEDEPEQTAYFEAELSVLRAYNATMPNTWPRAVEAPFAASRAAAIREFLCIAPTKPEMPKNYFAHCAANLAAEERCGFDWLIRKETYLRVREGAVKHLETA